MSLFEPAELACPACGVLITAELSNSVNADRRPDLRDEIMAAQFQRVPCDACGIAVQLPPALTYVDMARSQWILANPAASLAEWTELESIVRDTFEASYGAAAPSVAQEIGRALRPRIVFGWPALRERLIAAAEGIDDVDLECLKLGGVRNVGGSLLNDESEFRLVDADEDTLVLAWLVSDTEQELSFLEVPRATLAQIAGDAALVARASAIEIRRRAAIVRCRDQSHCGMGRAGRG